MPARRTLGYSITAAQVGLASDREYLNAPEGVRREVMSWVVKLGLKAKDAELAAGLDRFGEPLIPVSAETREHRESAMGPADPSAPALEPAYAVSRTRLLLEGDVALGKAARSDAADFTWGYDSHIGESWAVILKYHAQGKGRYGRIPKRDVIGLSDSYRASVRLAVMARWQLYKLHMARGTTQRIEPAPAIPAPRLRVIGRTDFEHFTYGIGANAASGAETSRRALAMGGSTGMFQFRPGGGQPAFGGPRNRLPGAYLPEPPLKTSGFWRGAQKPPKPKAAPKLAPVRVAPKSKAVKAPEVASPTVPEVPRRPYWATQPYGSRREEREAAAEITAKLAAYEEGDRKVAALRELGAFSAAKRARVGQVRKLYDEAEAVALRYATADRGGAEHAAAMVELGKLRMSLDDALHFAKKATAASRTAAMEVLRAGTPMEFRVAGHEALSGDARGAVAQAMEFLGAVVGKGSHQAPVEVNLKRATSRGGGRAYYDEGVVRLHKDSGAETAAHEIGHLLEDKVPGWLDAAKAFLGKRTTGEQFVPLSETDAAYGADEFGRKDRFEEAFGDGATYVGKFYHSGTEITSMGLEKLMDDPAGFAHNDPEFAKFLIGLLHGVLR